MTTRYNASLRGTLTLAALLLLTAGLSGCGVGLPTQPDIGSGAESGIHSNGRVAGAMWGESDLPGEIADSDASIGGGGGTGEIQPVGEIEVQTPGHSPGNSSWGHSHKKIRN